MTEETETPEERPDALHTHVSPGHLLRSARERRGWTVEEVSERTLLAEKTVRALEDNDFERLSQPVFVRGYYRKCADLLGIPEDEIMEAYAGWTGDSDPSPASPGQVDVIPQDVTPQAWRPSILTLLLAAALVLAVLGWLWLAEPQAGGESDAGTPAGERAASPAAGGDDTPAPAEAEAPPAVIPAPPETAAEPLAPASPEAQLVLRFDSRSWARVTDADGTTLIDGIVGGGNVRVLEGRPPYRVALGYAPGVNVSIDGRTVSLSDAVRANDTARFTVHADGGSTP